MPGREIPRELHEREEEIVARAVQVLGYGSDPLVADANLDSMVAAILQVVEPMVASITLRAFAVGAERVVVDLPESARTGAMAVVNAARDVAQGLDEGRGL